MNDKFLFLRDSSLLLERQFTHKKEFLSERLIAKGIGEIAFLHSDKETFASHGDQLLRLELIGYYNLFSGNRTFSFIY